MAQVILEDVVKTFDGTDVVRGLSLAIPDNEFLVIVGPSGCGKSTTLRMIAGLEEISGGTIRIGDRVVNDLRPRDRNIAMVFQNYALYPHMTVVENMSFGLQLAKTPKPVIEERVAEAVRILGLGRLLDRRPAQMSGGERQRVAMGRAIVRQPDVFLFDEPLSNLDAKLRMTMRTEIKRLHQKIDSTIVYVTHDQVEAMTLADRIAVLRDGRIEQVGTPREVFSQPANIFVAGFIGSPPMNFFDAVVSDGPGLRLAEGWEIPASESACAALAPGSRVTVGVRAEDIVPSGRGMPPQRSWQFDATVTLCEPLGSETLLMIDFAGREAISRMFQIEPIAPGERLSFDLNLDGLRLFDPDTGESIGGTPR